MAETNQSRTTKRWRDKGYYVEVTERVSRISKPGGGVIVHRNDLHGFADAVALNGEEIVYLQPTSWDNVHNRLRKICRDGTIGKGQWRVPLRDVARLLLSTGCCRILIEGWRQGKDLRYELKTREVTLADLEQ